MKKTKIVCTIGPASEDKKILTHLIASGMNVARLNFSHGDYEEHQARIDTIKEIREKFPTKTIWSYTGYLFDELKDNPKLKYLDVLVDGEFVEDLKNVNLPWVGSSNQRVIDVQASLCTGETVCLV